MSNSLFRKDGTAQGVAKQRLIESLAKPEERVIYDPYADRFVMGAGIIKMMGHSLNVCLSEKFIPGFHEHLVSRTRFIDDLIEDCAAAGVEQYVILGAGYDTRAHRLALPSTLQVFEVDQPGVQARKRAKLPKKLQNSDKVTYVSIDFNHQSLSKHLLNADFDQNKSTVYTFEGVSQYVTKEAVASTIEELAKLSQKAGSTFFMSYVDKLFIDDPARCFGQGYSKPVLRADTIMRLTEKVGEPWISFYSTSEIEELLSQNGFYLKENKSLGDLNSAYFAPLGRALPEEHILNLERFLVAKS